MSQTKWFERKFDFAFTHNIFPTIIMRLTTTPARLEEVLQRISGNILHGKPNGTWSIKENIGHLTDLEPLWRGRLDDILSGETTLRAADLANTRTDQANHNAKDLRVLLAEFRDTRKVTIDRITALPEKDIYKSALHPRLKTPMRTMDHFLFIAEHDDHHLARIQELLKNN